VSIDIRLIDEIANNPIELARLAKAFGLEWQSSVGLKSQKPPRRTRRRRFSKYRLMRRW